jgi:hypothetical protein
LDYKDGAKGKFDEQGNLTHDIEGRELTAPFVVGRRHVGGADEAFPPAQLDSLAEGLAGTRAEVVPPRAIGGDAGRVTTTTDRRSGRNNYDIGLSSANTPAQQPRVYAHEIAHVIDYIAGKIDQTDIKNDLQRIYHNLNDGSGRRLQNDTPRRLQTTPDSRGYSREKAPRELMAEAIRAYLADPNYIKEIAPKVAERIREVNDHPEIKKFVQFNADQAKASRPGVFAQAAEREGGGPFSQVPKTPSFDIYHGSPHDWPAERLVRHADGREEYIAGAPDKLPDVPDGAEVIKDFPLGRARLDKIGSGEGAQAYGHGHYGADVEATGKSYRDTLTQNMGGDGTQAGFWMSHALKQADYDADKAKDILRGKIKDFDGGKRPYGVAEKDDAYRAALGDALTQAEKAGGKMYQWRVNADPEHFLDWDKPLSQQSEAVNRAFDKLDGSRLLGKLTGAPINPLPREYYKGQPATGQAIHRALENALGSRDDVAAKLKELGIPGIRYLDQGSRGVGEGSRNWVVFSDDIIEILKKYGIIAPPVGAGLFGATKGEDDEG